MSISGYYAWLSRPPSARAIRHAGPGHLIVQVHQDSRGTYSALRVHAELRLGHGIMNRLLPDDLWAMLTTWNVR